MIEIVDVYARMGIIDFHFAIRLVILPAEDK